MVVSVARSSFVPPQSSELISSALDAGVLTSKFEPAEQRTVIVCPSGQDARDGSTMKSSAFVATPVTLTDLVSGGIEFLEI